MASGKRFKAVVWLLIVAPLVTAFPADEAVVISNYPNTELAKGDLERKEEARDPVIPADNERFKDTLEVDDVAQGQGDIVPRSSNVQNLENFQEEDRAFKYKEVHHQLNSQLLEDARKFSGHNVAIITRVKRSKKETKKKDDKKLDKKEAEKDSEEGEDEEKEKMMKKKDKKQAKKNKDMKKFDEDPTKEYAVLFRR